MENHGQVGESLLRAVADKFEITLADLYATMPPSSDNPLSFYPLALLNHAGLIEFNLEHTNNNGVQRYGIVGNTVNECASLLAEWCLTENEHRLLFKACLTAKGLLKLEELAQREEARKVKRTDYFVTAAVAVIAACVTGTIRLAFG